MSDNDGADVVFIEDLLEENERRIDAFIAAKKIEIAAKIGDPTATAVKPDDVPESVWQQWLVITRERNAENLSEVFQKLDEHARQLKMLAHEHNTLVN